MEKTDPITEGFEWQCSVTLTQQVVIKTFKIIFLSIIHAFQKNLKVKKHSMKNNSLFIQPGQTDFKIYVDQRLAKKLPGVEKSVGGGGGNLPYQDIEIPHYKFIVIKTVWVKYRIEKLTA